MYKHLIGRNIFVRTTIHVNTGILTSVNDKTITLENAAWVANTGYWSKFCNEGWAAEIEPFAQPIIMNRDIVMEYGEIPGPVTQSPYSYRRVKGDYRSTYQRTAPEALPVVHTDPAYAHLLGKRISARTVTMVDTGTLVAATDTDLILANADWIANTGKWSKFVRSGRGSEVEQFGPYYVAVSKQCLIEVTELPPATWAEL